MGYVGAFFLGMMCGGIIGVVIMALCVAASGNRRDDE